LQKDIKVARVNNTLVSSEQLISMINDDFGIETKGKDKTRMLRDLSDFIINQYAQGMRTALIIDEAQNLSPELLEEIRLLSNLETDKSKLLQIILLGQPELKRTLAVPELRQLRQRISINCHINPLDRTETEEYVLHRLEIAGNREAVSFLDGALDALHSATHGIPRLINIFCDFLLLTAFNEGIKEISADMVREIATDLDAENRYWGDSPRKGGHDTGDNALQSVQRRLDNLEAAAIHGQSNTEINIEDIADRIATLEKVVEKLISAVRREVAPPDNPHLRAIQREVEFLKSKNIELEQKQNAIAESDSQKKKTFWSRKRI
jgi:general secretion pathway protein A